MPMHGYVAGQFFYVRLRPVARKWRRRDIAIDKFVGDDHVADAIVVYRPGGAEVDRLAYAFAVERPENDFGVVAINIARGDDLSLAFAVAIKIDV